MKFYPSEEGNCGSSIADHLHNFTVLAQGNAKDESRSLNVPFCVNIMAGGRYINSSQVSFTSLSGIEYFQVQKTTAAQKGGEAERTQLHQHDFFELMYVFEGSVEQQIEKGCFAYTAGQACLLNRNTRHYEVLGEDYLLVFFCLSKEYLMQFRPYAMGSENEIHRFFSGNHQDQIKYKKDYLDFRPTAEGDGAGKARGLMEQIVNELVQGQIAYQDVVRGLMVRLFTLLADPGAYTCTHVVLDSTKEAYLFGKIKALIEEKNGRVTRSELETALFYSSDYLNRIIKKHTGLNFSEYCQRVSLKKAAELLLNSSASINSIVAELGFGNKTYFYRLFKQERGMTPMEYRKAHLAKESD